MAQNLKISAIQINIYEDVAGNLENAAELAGKCEGDIIVLPELFTTGFSRNSLYFAENKYSGISFLTLKEISKKRKILIIGGLTEENKDCRNKPFNTAIVYDSGKLIGEYRKIHLFKYGDEHLYYSAGDQIFTCEFERAKFKTKIGFMICYDLRFPETAREIMKLGAEIIIVPANFPDERKEHWKALLKARAIENLCYVAGVNANEIHNNYIDGKFGKTTCYDPWGNLVKGKTKDFKEGKIFEFEFNIEKVRKLRNKYKFLDEIVIL
ncbi:putative enzyme [groundwater metagenome]|uniref:Putative enzyme n=1 Tax=groundwater metagenome TaxID=717931 RepID=A0A098E665_9ZZZZ